MPEDTRLALKRWTSVGLMGESMPLYGTYRLPLKGLLLAAILHLFGWVYLMIAPFKLPKKAATLDAEKFNPFAPPT